MEEGGTEEGNTLLSCQPYPGADIPSDHNLLLARIKLILEKITKEILPRKANVGKPKLNNVV